VLGELARCVGDDLLDVHADAHHHRSVFTLLGTSAPRVLTTAAVARLDLAAHSGAHPRLGVVDVVPFVPLHGGPLGPALAARDEFARWASTTLGVPCFLYGPERSLPEIRRRAWRTLSPDFGPSTPHPRAGALCVGARRELVAYNVVLRRTDRALAGSIAALIRSPHLRALGLSVGDEVQVSMNLIEPSLIGPAQAYDLVARHAAIERAELVGLLPAHVLTATPRRRWAELDLAGDRTIEWRCENGAQAEAVRRVDRAR
jgi:glutamate formiminotransferase